MASSLRSFYKFRFCVQGVKLDRVDQDRWSRQTQEKVAIKFCSTKYLFDNDLRLVPFQKYLFPRTRGFFWVPRDAARLSDGGARMSPLLSVLGVHAQHQQRVLRDIASEVAAQTPGKDSWPILVILQHSYTVFQEVDNEEPSRDEMDMVLRESMDVDFVRTTPASRSWIMQSEKATYEEGLGLMDECIFCTEQFKVGLELIRLPCSHVYHGNCIVKWLEKSHLCPLCRHALPTAD